MKQKIYFVIPSFAGGGAERVMISYANSIDRDRYEATIVTGNGVGPLISEINLDVAIIDLNCVRMRKALLLAKVLQGRGKLRHFNNGLHQFLPCFSSANSGPPDVLYFPRGQYSECGAGEELPKGPIENSL